MDCLKLNIYITFIFHLFLEDLFQSHSPFKILAEQRDFLISKIISNCVAIDDARFEKIENYYHFLQKTENAYTREPYQFKSKEIIVLTNYSRRELNDVVFRVVVILNFLQSRDFDLTKFLHIFKVII